MSSGIYMFTCTENEARYIGSSKNLRSRKMDHIYQLRHGNHHNLHFQSIYDKYGEDSLKYEVLEKCKKDILIEREQFWIDKLNPEINKALFADSGFLGHNHTEKSKEKNRRKAKERMKSPELRKRISNSLKKYYQTHNNPSLGKPKSEETKEKLRQANKKQFSDPVLKKRHHDAMKEWMTDEMRERIRQKKMGTKHSQETKEKMSKSHAKTYKGFVSPKGIVYKDVCNLKEFCKEHGLHKTGMYDLVHGRKKSHKGWTSL